MMTGALMLIGMAAPAAMAQAPAGWACEKSFYEDGVCDCGCVELDADCADGTFEVCERSGCGKGEVPWEHRPWTCMTSACGDGWHDEAMGEACDDGNALNRGGCSADCQVINDGWDCGERAEGCWEVKEKPKPKPKPEPKDTGDPVAPTDDDGAVESSGCSHVPASFGGWMALVGLLIRRHRRR